MKLRSSTGFCSDPAEAAKMITDRFGIEILADHKRFCSAFSDFAPKLSRENKAFFVALSEKTGELYLRENQNVLSGNTDPADVIQRAVNEIGEYLNHEKAAMVANSLAYALGWEISDVPEADESGSYELPRTGSAIEDLFRKANNGDNDACFNLGERFYYGNGVKQDYSKAMEWYGKAAARGDCSSQKKLAECWRAGHGAERDLSQAVKWYLKAAEQGDYDSQRAAVRCYKLGGKGLPPDRERSQQLALRYGIEDNSSELDDMITAAENGDAEAQFRLGNIYFSGSGTGTDRESAVYWYKLAAEQDHALSQFNLARCYEEGTGVKRDPERAAELYRQAAENGDSDALNNLAIMHFNGEGVPEGRAFAVKLWAMAAEDGIPKAQYNYGECLFNGWGVMRDRTKAVKWYKAAAAQSDPDALYSYGWCLWTGEGAAKDHSLAFKMFERSAQQRNIHAMKALGYMHMNGQGTEKNFGKAAEMFRKSAAAGDKESAKMLVMCYKYGGFYLIANREKAMEYADKYGIDINSV